MSNKRNQPRVSLDIYLNKYMAGVPYMARASDISREGVGLAHLIEPDAAGKRVGLQFQLPGSEEVIYAEGEVVREWCDLFLVHKADLAGAEIMAQSLVEIGAPEENVLIVSSKTGK